MTASFWSALVPWLLLVWLFLVLSGRRGVVGGFVCAVAAAAVLVFPWWGHPLPYWSRALLANFSIPTAGLLVVAVIGMVRRRPLFEPQDWRAAWIFGAVASFALYPSALGLGPRSFDAYALGWPWLFWGQSGVLFGGVALATAFLLWRGNRFGFLLLAGLVAFSAQLQESQNLWDYLVDPLFGGFSILLVSRRLLSRHRGG